MTLWKQVWWLSLNRNGLFDIFRLGGGGGGHLLHCIFVISGHFTMKFAKG